MISKEQLAYENALRDCVRYQWLKERFMGFDSHWSEPEIPILVFEMPEKMRVSANLDQTIDDQISRESHEAI